MTITRHHHRSGDADTRITWLEDRVIEAHFAERAAPRLVDAACPGPGGLGVIMQGSVTGIGLPGQHVNREARRA